MVNPSRRFLTDSSLSSMINGEAHDRGTEAERNPLAVSRRPSSYEDGSLSWPP